MSVSGRSRFGSGVRERAVRRAFGGASSPSDVAHELGCSVATLYRWRAAPPIPDEDEPHGRERLVAAALACLQERVYAEVTLEEVAARAGLSPQGAYRHFDSKRDLFAASVARAGELVTAAFVDLAAAGLNDAGHALAIMLDAVLATPQTKVLFTDVGVPQEQAHIRRWHAMFMTLLATLLYEDRDAETANRQADVLASASRGLIAGVFEGNDPDVTRSVLRALPDSLS